MKRLVCQYCELDFPSFLAAVAGAGAGRARFTGAGFEAVFAGRGLLGSTELLCDGAEFAVIVGPT